MSIKESKRNERKIQQLMREEKPGQLHAQQNDPIRKLRHIYEPLINSFIPKEWTADDIVFNRFYGIKTAVDDVVALSASGVNDNKSFRRDKIKFMTSAILDLGDGARARLEKAEPSVRNQLVDVVADRVDEAYSASRIGFLLFEKEDNNPDVLMSALHLSRNTTTTTIARYLGNAFGRFVPEMTPKNIGGTRYDKIKYLFKALRDITNGKYTNSYENIQKLSDIVDRSDAFRRNEANFKDSSQISNLDPEKFQGENFKNLRNSFEIALELIDIFFQSHEWNISQIKTNLSKDGNLNPNDINSLVERYEKEAKDPEQNPGSAIYFSLMSGGKVGREAIKDIRAKWQKVFPDEFREYPEFDFESFLNLSPREENYLSKMPKNKIRRNIYGIILPKRKDNNENKSLSVGLNEIIAKYRPYIQKSIIEAFTDPSLSVDAIQPLLYHFGWIDENGQENKKNEIFPGKGIRPILLAMTYDALGGNPEKISSLGATLELIHNFSLIHDDIEDRDTLRHGKATLWSTERWGEAQAINTGDYLLSVALKQIANLKEAGFSDNQVLTATNSVLKTILHMIEGQHMDIGFEKKQDISVKDYMKMIKGKTGAMIDAPIYLAAYLSNADDATTRVLANYSDALGKLFQIKDDYLGIWGDTSTTGKSDDGDIKKRKKSYPVIYALEKAKESKNSSEGNRLLAFYSNGHEPTDEEINQIRRDLEFFGAKEEAERAVKSYHQTAISAINESLLDTNQRRNFLTIADFLKAREK